ncbi:hybrid sensor histidine kinase/response regulator [Geminicoccus roseus]|uniref:hybrid sensor histidine kinase/response regulator n=1 Tax=Geminicoccus roseus TaxID=404900 RepID=UPI00042057FB|nr:hybrid sensor histidine kinase/response regulator [Geminicoccus roseus]
MTISERALVFTPTGRDASVAAALLREAGIGSTICCDMEALCHGLAEGAGLAIVTEEAFRTSNLRMVAQWIEQQPSWSDFPFVLLTERGSDTEQNPVAARLSSVLGNVIFLERPFHPTTLIGVVQNALRGRRRQYEARTQLEAIRESEERLSMALKAGHLGTWEYDLATGVLTTSEHCRMNFGRSPDDPFSYEELLESVHPADRARMKAAVRHSITSGDDYLIEYRVVWPDGSLHWIEIRARIIEDGRSRRLIGVSSDITAQKTAQAELLRFSETLEQQVQERTAELRQKEAALRQAQKMETIGQLTGGVAHDFNNLLMAVIGNIDLLRQKIPDSPHLQRYLDGALQGAQRGAALTQRLLAFARRQDLAPEPVDLRLLVEGMHALIERSLGPLISIDLRLADAMPPAIVDSNQLELAILNLTVNARDAMPDGGRLTIELDQRPPPIGLALTPGQYLRLAVRDNGAGMDARTLERAIEPFFSTKEFGKGTGLGLSMVHGLAVQLGGTLNIVSRIGEGTTAELWLPVSEVEVKRGVTSDQEVTAAPSSTILVVDDDALIAMSTVDMLEDLGHTVIDAQSGKQALEILEGGTHVDAIVTDHAMPGMTGAELAMKARELRPDIPILLTTGYADLPAGVGIDLPRLGKPYQQRDLAEKLSKLLNAARETRLADAAKDPVD